MRQRIFLVIDFAVNGEDVRADVIFYHTNTSYGQHVVDLLDIVRNLFVHLLQLLDVLQELFVRKGHLCYFPTSAKETDAFAFVVEHGNNLKLVIGLFFPNETSKVFSLVSVGQQHGGIEHFEVVCNQIGHACNIADREVFGDDRRLRCFEYLQNSFVHVFDIAVLVEKNHAYHTRIEDRLITKHGILRLTMTYDLFCNIVL